MTQTLTVTLAEILGAARVRAASLVPETSAYLALALAETVLSGRASRGMPSLATLDTDGGLSGAPRGEGDLGRAYRSLLGALLSASTGSMPSIAAVADPAAADARPGLDAFAAELEAALIPLNRAAAKRALARLARETARARRLRRLPAVGAELDAFFGALPARTAAPATPALPVAVRQPEPPRLERTPLQSFAVEPKATPRPRPVPHPRAPTPTPPFAEEAFFGALDPSVHAPTVLENDGPLPEPEPEHLDPPSDLSGVEVDVAFTAADAPYEPLPSVVEPVPEASARADDEPFPVEAAPSRAAPVDEGEPVDEEPEDDALTRPFTRLAPLAAPAPAAEEEATPFEPEAPLEAHEDPAEPSDATEIDEVAAVAAAEAQPSPVPAEASASPAPVARPETPPPAHTAPTPRPTEVTPPPVTPLPALAAPTPRPIEVAPPPVAAPEVPAAEVPALRRHPRASSSTRAGSRPGVTLPTSPDRPAESFGSAGTTSPIAATDEALRPRARSARELAASFAASGEDQSLRLAQRSLKAYVGLALTPPPPASVREETPSPQAPGPAGLPALAPAVAFAGSVARRRVPLGWVLLATFVFTALAALALRHPLVVRALVGR